MDDVWSMKCTIAGNNMLSILYLHTITLISFQDWKLRFLSTRLPTYFSTFLTRLKTYLDSDGKSSQMSNKHSMPSMCSGNLWIDKSPTESPSRSKVVSFQSTRTRQKFSRTVHTWFMPIQIWQALKIVGAVGHLDFGIDISKNWTGLSYLANSR